MNHATSSCVCSSPVFFHLPPRAPSLFHLPQEGNPHHLLNTQDPLWVVVREDDTWATVSLGWGAPLERRSRCLHSNNPSAQHCMALTTLPWLMRAKHPLYVETPLSLTDPCSLFGTSGMAVIIGQNWNLARQYDSVFWDNFTSVAPTDKAGKEADQATQRSTPALEPGRPKIWTSLLPFTPLVSFCTSKPQFYYLQNGYISASLSQSASANAPSSEFLLG